MSLQGQGNLWDKFKKSGLYKGNKGKTKTNKNIVTKRPQVDKYWTNDKKKYLDKNKICPILVLPDTKINILVLAYQRIMALMSIYPNTEWSADLIGEKKEDVFTIDNIYIYLQKVSTVSVDREENSPKGSVGIIHSHHSMGSGFSGTDEEYVNQNHEISGVVAKKGGSLEFNFIRSLKLDCGKWAFHKIKNDNIQIDFSIDETLITEEEKKKIVEEVYESGYQGYNNPEYDYDNMGFGGYRESYNPPNINHTNKEDEKIFICKICGSEINTYNSGPEIQGWCYTCKDYMKGDEIIEILPFNNDEEDEEMEPSEESPHIRHSMRCPHCGKEGLDYYYLDKGKFPYLCINPKCKVWSAKDMVEAYNKIKILEESTDEEEWLSSSDYPLNNKTNDEEWRSVFNAEEPKLSEPTHMKCPSCFKSSLIRILEHNKWQNDYWCKECKEIMLRNEVEEYILNKE